MEERPVTVFGGTGFLGRRVVRRLRVDGVPVRIATRHPARSRALFGTEDVHLHPIRADIHDEASVAAALDGAAGAVNAVSLYVERGQETFRAVHVEAAERVARRARAADDACYLHISGIGADPRSQSSYIRSRGEGEAAVRAAHPNATILRPSVMIGPDDSLLTTILGLVRRLPVYPLFGSGETRLQPVHVEDVAEAIARIFRQPTGVTIYEIGGPRTYTYAELVGAVARCAGCSTRLLPMPFAAWHALAAIGTMLPHPPITQNQIELMRHDNVTSSERPGLEALAIKPQTVEQVLSEICSM